MKVNERYTLKGFGVGVTRAASNMGGGGAGWGSICGAVSGAIMAIGLAMGTDGTETPTEYTATRERMRSYTQEFLRDYEARWGHIICFDLLGADTRTPEGKAKYEADKAKGLNHCDDFVQWSADRVIKLFNEKGIRQIK